MKQLITIILFFSTVSIHAQKKVAANPADGLETFSKELVDVIVFPHEYYENGGLTLRVSVDSVANVKLVTIKPYNAAFYSDLKMFVENTKWNPGSIDGKLKTQIISLPIKLNKEVVGITQKATPVKGMKEFFRGMIAAVNNPEDVIWREKFKAKFIVTKDGEVKDIEFYPPNQSLEYDIKPYLRRTKWNPAYHNGEEVDSSYTLPITIVVNNDK